MITDEQAKTLVAKYGSPLYIFDIDELRQRTQAIRQILGEYIGLCYAMKANPFLVDYLSKMTDGIEVCSPGELEICKKMHVPDEKIILSGVHKSNSNFNDLAKTRFKGIITIESKLQFKYLIENLSPNHNVNVILRLTSGNQFGMEQEEIEYLTRESKNYPNVNVCGLHFFSGTQKKDLDIIEKEISLVNETLLSMMHILNAESLRIEYGPGLFVDYFNDVDINDLCFLKSTVEKFTALKGKVVIELGRYIAASCGYYITKVADKKHNAGHNYCIVDGGIHQLHYYGQMLGIKSPIFRHIKTNNKPDDKDEELWNVCGSLCTVNDFLLRNAKLQTVDIGDLFMFQNTGAYSVTESVALFLSRDLPLVLLIDDNKEIVARKRLSTSNLNCLGGIVNGLV